MYTIQVGPELVLPIGYGSQRFHDIMSKFLGPDILDIISGLDLALINNDIKDCSIKELNLSHNMATLLFYVFQYQI